MAHGLPGGKGEWQGGSSGKYITENKEKRDVIREDQARHEPDLEGCQHHPALPCTPVLQCLAFPTPQHTPQNLTLPMFSGACHLPSPSLSLESMSAQITKIISQASRVGPLCNEDERD